MKNKIVMWLFSYFLIGICCTEMKAQERQVMLSGIISDTTGEPLIGATVSIKGETTGTITDLDGKYQLQVKRGDVLVFQYIGYRSRELSFNGQNPLNITLEEESQLLQEVTVTALGIKREKKALGYAVGEVQGGELDKAKETNVINALAGKVPGLVISQTAGGPSGSSRVTIRGNTELTGNNQPLYVVDGVPLDNTSYGSADANGGYDLGDGISAINPDDIETMSVLKGPAASALYGSRASHGVILITTKKAAKDKRLGIDVNSTTTFDWQLTGYDDLQTLYGQGSGGRIRGTGDDNDSYNRSWGPKIDPDLHITYFDGVTRPYAYQKDRISGFFRTGVTSTHTAILQSQTEKGGVRLSYTHMSNRDIVPESGMSRNTLNIRATTTVARKLNLDLKAGYMREDVKNRPSLSNSISNIGKNLITLASTFNQSWLATHYKTETGEYYDWNNHDIYNLNPYWIIREMSNESDKDKFSGTATLSYTLGDKWSARITAGGELNLFRFQNFAPWSTPGNESGLLQIQSFRNYTYNIEALVSYKDQAGKWTWGANAGANLFRVDNHTEVITAKEMEMRQTVALQSFRQKEITEDLYRKQINSLMAMANAGWNDMLFLDATLRMDKSSTLPHGNNVYMYPSVSGSFLFSELLPRWRHILPYGKLRASFAQVGSDTDPFKLDLTYSMLDKAYGNYALGHIYNAEIPNRRLKPTRTNSWEAGLDLRFLNSRIGLELTYYAQNSRDQIMRLNTSSASGYNTKMINAGEIENRGIEIGLNTRPVDGKNFSWDLNLNFAKNSNRVKALADGLERFTLANAAWLDVTVDAVVGQNYGAIMGYDFLRNEDGQVIIDGATGLPKKTAEKQILGNATWDWTGGVSTTLRYRNLSLSAIFDVKVGADLYSMTARSLYSTGLHKETLQGRDEWYRSEEQRLAAGVRETEWPPTGGFVAPGVIEETAPDGTKTYRENDIIVDPQDYWSEVCKNIAAKFVYDNSYVKCREITLSFRLPGKWLKGWAQEAGIALVARNPFIVWKNIENVDPDSNYNNSTGMGLECGSLPSRRSFGFNINLKF